MSMTDRMADDNFALPRGIDWIPVDRAMAMLNDRLPVIRETRNIGIGAATGRVLAEGVVATRDNPPADNSAIDGYGFWLDPGQSCDSLDLLTGCSAPGLPYRDHVPPGHAVRVLTGATLPHGVNTLVLEENVTMDGDRIIIGRCPESGSNCRRTGEDFVSGEVLFPAGHRMKSNDMATLAGSGKGKVSVHRNPRIGVLSTGDELTESGNPASRHEIYDMNRPMLLSVIARWGFEPVDFGRLPDDSEMIAELLDRAASSVDALLTTGGASASEQDRISAVLSGRGHLHFWRIAIKPGRPMAMGNWQGLPVFGLPGNPIAAFVCTLVFAYPAIRMISGEAFRPPEGFAVQAAFAKTKKRGRREYLRARLNHDGHAEVYHSEGSGLTRGLAWSDGLVELGDEAMHIRKGSIVRYIPYSSFGL